MSSDGSSMAIDLLQTSKYQHVQPPHDRQLCSTDDIRANHSSSVVSVIFIGLGPENAPESGNQIMAIERLLQTIGTPRRSPLPGTIMFPGAGDQPNRQ